MPSLGPRAAKDSKRHSEDLHALLQGELTLATGHAMKRDTVLVDAVSKLLGFSSVALVSSLILDAVRPRK